MERVCLHRESSWKIAKKNALLNAAKAGLVLIQTGIFYFVWEVSYQGCRPETWVEWQDILLVGIYLALTCVCLGVTDEKTLLLTISCESYLYYLPRFRILSRGWTALWYELEIFYSGRTRPVRRVGLYSREDLTSGCGLPMWTAFQQPKRWIEVLYWPRDPGVYQTQDWRFVD